MAAVLDSVSAGQQLSVCNHIFNCLNNFMVDYLPLVEETGNTLNADGCVDLESRWLKCDLSSKESADSLG